jgi:PilZ domain
MVERRGNRRLKSFLRGFVEIDKRRGAMSCMVRDFSDTGARIIFSDAIVIPDTVNLHIPQRDFTTRARVEWRRGDEIGLSFADASRAPPDSAELMARIAQLEGEIAGLRGALRRLKKDAPRSDDDAA